VLGKATREPKRPPIFSVPTSGNKRNWTLINAALFVAFAIYVFYYLTAFRFDTLFTVEPRQVDFRMWYLFPQLILRTTHYPAVITHDWATNFSYPPSAVAMMLLLGVASQTTAFGFWIVLQGLAFITVLWTGIRLCGASGQPYSLLVAAVAVFLADSAIGWDFRNHNNNLIYLALIMLSLSTKRAWLSGLLLAVSFNLKLYSGLVLGAFLWRREFSVAGYMILASVIVGVVVPIMVFGPPGYLQLLHDWADQIRYTLSPTIQASAPTTLLRSITTLLGTSPSSTTVTIVLRATQAAWVGLLAIYFVVAARQQPTDPIARNQARLSDIIVSLLAPLPVSTWFLPYHAVVMIPAWLLLVTVAANDAWPKWMRWIIICAMGTSQILRFSIRDWDYRGGMYFITFVILVAALALVRRHLVTSDGA
jgi:hypothetical protein